MAKADKSVLTAEQRAICKFQTFVRTQEKLRVLPLEDSSNCRIIQMDDKSQKKRKKKLECLSEMLGHHEPPEELRDSTKDVPSFGVLTVVTENTI